MKIKGETIILIAIVGIGAYVLWKMFNLAKGPGEVIEGVIDRGKDILTKPIVPDLPDVGLKGPTVIDYIFPPAGIPKFIENFVITPKGDPNVMVAPIKAVASFALATGLIKPTPKVDAPVIKRVSPIGAYYTPVIGGSIAHNVLVPTKPGQTPGRQAVTSLHGTKSASGFTIGGR